MVKKMFAVFTSIVAGLAVVGVAWASGDDDTSTSITAGNETSASVTADVSTPSTEVTVPGSSPTTSVGASTSTSSNTSSSTSVDATTPTTTHGTTSTSVASSTSTSVGSSTSASVDDIDARTAPDGISTHILPGVGSVTIEVAAGRLILVSVSAPGWNVERDKLEHDRIELEFTSGPRAEAEFEARLNNGRVEVEIEVDLD